MASTLAVVRATRKFFVPTSNGGGGSGGSAEMWPASSSTAPAGAVGSGLGPRRRSVSSSATALSPASRPADFPQISSDFNMLAEIGFDRARVGKLLESCRGDVERAAEWLSSDADGGFSMLSDGRSWEYNYCSSCTFSNKDPAHGTVCERCDIPQPSRVLFPSNGGFKNVDWDGFGSSSFGDSP